MVFVNKKTYLSIFSIFFIYACQIDNNVNLGDDLQKQVIDENIVFEKYLSNQGEQNLKDRPIFGMSGYAGNVILIDPETSKIVVLHSIHHKDKKGSKYYYDFKKIVLEVFK